MSYQLIATKNVTKNNGPQRIAVVDATELLLKLTTVNSFVSGYEVERSFNSGKQFRLRWLQANLSGKLIPLEYGEHEILFDVPFALLPYEIEILPNYLTFTYTVEIFKAIYNPRFDALAEKLGITVELLRNIPQQTLLILEGLNLMASSDTRQLIATIEQQALEALITREMTDAINVQNTATVATLAAVKSELLTQEEYELVSASFVFRNGFMVANVDHGLSGGKVQMSLMDAQGDVQGFSQLIATSPTKATVELTVSQHADNSYPLTFLLQGKKGNAVALGSFIRQPVSDRYYRLANGMIDSSTDGVTVENAGLANNVVSAFLTNDSQFVYILLTNGAFVKIDNGNLGAGLLATGTVEYDAEFAKTDKVTLV